MLKIAYKFLEERSTPKILKCPLMREFNSRIDLFRRGTPSQPHNYRIIFLYLIRYGLSAFTQNSILRDTFTDLRYIFS
jgi:hypothetical protein